MTRFIKSIRKNHHFQRLVGMFVFLNVFVCSAKILTNVASRSKVQIENIQGYLLRNITTQLSKEFANISNEELGVSIIQEMYSELKYTLVVEDVNKTLKQMVNKLEIKLNETIRLLNETRSQIESYSKLHGLQMHSVITPCKNKKDDGKLEAISSNNLNITQSEHFRTLSQVLDRQKLRAKKIKGTIKQLYLLSTWDISIISESPIFNCNYQDQSLLWKQFLNYRKPPPKNVMLLLDHGGSLSKQQFRIVKAVAKQMIEVLNKDDKVGVLGISDDWNSPYLTEQCLMPNQNPPVSDSHVISPATKHNKYLLIKFIDSLTKGSGVTNHSLGFQQALQIIKSSNISSNETVMLLYISRGLLSSLTEAKTVLETISSMMDNADMKIIINACAVIDESKPVMYETHFLRDIAKQNYSKYNVSTSHDAKLGIMLSINSTQAIGLAVARFYETIGNSSFFKLDPIISLPVWDDVASDLSISAIIPCGINGKIGLLGIDLYFAAIVEDVTYYSNHYYYTYAFVINSEGIAVAHPSYPRPSFIKEQPKFVDIMNLEKVYDFKTVRKLLLSEKEGFYVLKTKNGTLRYNWKKAKNLYTICIVIHEDEVLPVRPYKVNWFPVIANYKLVHHRFDILPITNLCRHLNQIATLDSGSLYLSASCFQSPFFHVNLVTDVDREVSQVQSYMAYLKDNTRLLANPGLKEEVRDDVIALAHILEFLRIQHLTGTRTKYIVRRYVTSPSGVLQIFPAAFVSGKIEPTRRLWYLRAVENEFKVILTPPYLDAGGAGYIVTIAYATSHVVVAMDVTFGYIYKLMLQYMPFCIEKNIKCLMMDDGGYLIYHPKLIDPNGHGPIEQQHIIHKESLVANDILNHKHFVTKKLCNNYADGTIQRYYKLNMSMNDVLVNVVHGEHCIKYQITTVKGTNVFVGVVNATCEVVATFCPCSMVDRLCLNCNRMEQKECECPCECPLNLDTCTHPNHTLIENPLCSILPEQNFPLPLEPSIKTDSKLKVCIPISCESHLTYESCLGVIGCEWCKWDVDGESLLANPFCTSFSTCFNGILGSVTPYGDNDGGSLVAEDLLNSSYSPIGPIIGSVLGICLVLILFFCYRSYSSPTTERFYFSTAQNNQVRMSDFNMSDEFQECDNHQDKLLQNAKKKNPISPYCVSTEYRRPLTAVDSDHGYSTMTPHDESEHLSFLPVEIDSLEDDCISDATSINTYVSPRQPKVVLDVKNKMRAVLPSTDLQITTTANRIIAPVTVHRNMEIT